MPIKFEVKMTKNAMFDFMLYTSYTSLGGIAGVILGGVTLVLAIQRIMEGAYTSAAPFLVIAFFFLIGNPITLWTRSKDQVTKSPMFQKPISYEMGEEGLRISQGEASTLNKWEDFRKVISTNQSIILYVTKVRAIILPREALGEQYGTVAQMIVTHMPAKAVKIRHVSA